MPAPRLSIIVLTWNEEANIAACLASIASQEEAGQVEVVVVDAGSTDGTVAAIRQAMQATPLSLRLHVGPTRMPIGAARNLGVQWAQAPAVAFLSADAELGPGWVKQALAGLDSAGMVFGPQLHEPHEWTLGAAVRGLRYQFPDTATDEPLRFASNVAAAYSKELLLRFPFDPWANAAEDMLLAKRAAAAGYVAAYDPLMLVRHHDVSSWRQEMRKNLREGRGCGMYAAELGVQWPVLAWAGAMVATGSLAFFFPATGLALLAAALLAPALRRGWRRRKALPVRYLVAGVAASPAFDLVFLAQYLHGLVRRPTAEPGHPDTEA